MLCRTEKVVIAGDGTRLYARETRTIGGMGDDKGGASGVPMLCANGIGVSTIFWKYLEQHFPQTRPVITWDYRGHGNSEFPRDLDDLTIEASAGDMAKVLAAFGHERAIVLGHSMGCQVIYTFAHLYPEKTAMLVPILGGYGRPVHSFLDAELPSLIGFMIGHRLTTLMPNVLQRGQQRMLTGKRGRRIASKLARLSGLVHADRMPQVDLDAYLNHFGSFPPLVFFRMAEKMASHTAEPWLPSITAPALVIAGERDLFTPLHLSELAADRMPNARLFVLQEGSHAAIVEQPELIHAEIEATIADHEVDAAPRAEAAQVA
jgi:pimeloyl-ACP methyl ester carboxylesterase